MHLLDFLRKVAYRHLPVPIFTYMNKQIPRLLQMNYLKLLFLFVFLGWTQITESQNIEGRTITNQLVIQSNILNEKRTCLISLPDSYEETSLLDQKYPVIILLDGYTFFKTTIGVVHFMSSARNRNHLMPESIIVAIENVDRERDFTTTKIKTKRPNTMGGGLKFLNFIEKELVPFLDKTYRTEQTRTLIGHSLGGLLVLNSYLDENRLFDSYIAIDPSIWWDEEIMKNRIDSTSLSGLNKKLYIASANQGEANFERNKKRHDAFYSLISDRFGPDLKIKVAYFDKEDHRSVPLIALYEGLKYLNQED